VEKLTAREQKLLLTMRDYLFEQHAQMKNMFRRCDPDNNGYVSIEEFLNAMSRAGVPMGHGLDRQAATISEEEAARIVGFFDKEGDGRLRYHEFMTMLQSTKNSVLTKRVLQPSRP
jgi:Ca2+-binding EF-hand superfamily protein